MITNISRFIFVASLSLLTACSSKPTQNSKTEQSSNVEKKSSEGSPGNAGNAEAVSNPNMTDEPIPEPEKKASQTYLPLEKAVRGGQTQPILDEVAKLLSVKPNDPMALNTLALYHYRKGHPGAARLLLNRAFEKNEPSAALYNNLGVIFLDDGDQGSAIVNFKKALTIEDTNSAALGNLGSIYAKGGDLTRAMPLLAKAHQQNPTNTAVSNNYAIALRGSGQYEEARKIYEGLLQKNHDDVAVNLNLAILLVDYMSKPKDGLVIINRLKFLDTERKDVRTRLNALEKKARAEVQ